MQVKLKLTLFEGFHFTFNMTQCNVS